MKLWRLPWLSVLLAGAVLSSMNATKLELLVVDETGEPVPCRVLVRSADGKCAIPAKGDPVTLKIGADQWFISPGKSQLTFPPGEVEVRVEHGHEFLRLKQRQSFGKGKFASTVKLTRWINMKQHGYLCGENHLHVDSTSLAPQLAAEGLDFGTSLTWWNGPDARRPVPPGDGPLRTLEYGGRKIPTSIHDAELEHGWGAAYIQNLPMPLPIAAEGARPNLDYLEHAVNVGGLVHYQGGWSREVGLDALLGFVHTVNVCNNNFHLHKFQPRSRYSNLLNIEGFPVYPDTEEGMMRMNTDTYYRLLNWGLRLAAGAGSATGAKQTPVGYNRAYVRVNPNATLAEFNRAWAQGKNFVTNGPMILLTAGKAKGPGDEIALQGEGREVAISLEAISAQPLQVVEVVVNGKVVISLPGKDGLHLVHEGTITVPQGAWIAARCVARDDHLTDEELSAYRKEARFSEAPSRIRFAHTSPIYITVNGKGARVRRSLEEGLQMMDALQRYGQETAGPDHRAGILEAIEKARKILKSRLQETNE